MLSPLYDYQVFILHIITKNCEDPVVFVAMK